MDSYASHIDGFIYTSECLSNTYVADDLTDKEAAATIKKLKKLCDSIIES